MSLRWVVWTRLSGLLLAVAGFGLAAASPALADSTIGTTGGDRVCASGFEAADPSYVVPAGGGIITSFSYGDDGNNAGKQLDFQVLAPNPDGSYTIVGHTGLQTLSGVNGVETFAANLTVSGGEILGYFESGTDNCLFFGTLGTVLASHVGSDPSVGTTLNLNLPVADYSLNESANLAPPASGPASLTATGASLAGTEGQTLSGAVATFADSDAQPAGDYAATINWGDGSSSAGSVVPTGSGQYEVDASHTYVEAGTYAASVQVTDADGTSTQVQSAMTVSDAPLTASGLGSASAPGLSQPSFSGTVATVSDGNSLGSAADLTATIDWGDGTSTQGTVTGGGGSYSVAGSHAYLDDGPYTVQVHVTDQGGSTADATSQLLVYGLADQSGGSFVIGDGAGGGDVYFWGAQWAAENPLTGGTAPAAFKGFADTSAQSCGDTFTARPGNSSAPPAAVPSYMAVAVTGDVSKSGGLITGTVEKVVIVKTDPGYGPQPGSSGTGQVVATLCG